MKTNEEKIREVLRILSKKQVNGSGIVVLSQEEQQKIIDLLVEVSRSLGV